jgi:hypothetical protein
MGALFQSLGRTITAGVVLLIVIIIVAGLGTGTWVRASDHACGPSCSAGCTCCRA